MKEMTAVKKSKYGENVYHRHRSFQLSKAYWKMIEKEWKTCINQFGLNINEYTILMSICYSGKITATQLSELGMMHVSTALNFSKNLEKSGLVAIRKDVFDRRTTIIEITEEGIEKIHQIENYWENRYHREGVGLSVTGLSGNESITEVDIKEILEDYYGTSVMQHIDFICGAVKDEAISKYDLA